MSDTEFKLLKAPIIEAVLDIDSAGISAGEISYQLFERRGRLIRILG